MARKIFKDSAEAARQRLIRKAIRSAKFTKGERDVTLALVNHWFYHKNGPKGFIHPGRKKIAKRADVSVVTVARTFAMLRDRGAITPLNHLNGLKGKSTEYTVNEIALLVICGKGWLDQYMAYRNVSNDTSYQFGNDTSDPYQNDTPYIDNVLPFHGRFKDEPF